MALQVADAALLAQEHIPPVHLQPFVLLITPTCVPQRAQAASDIARRQLALSTTARRGKCRVAGSRP